MTTTDLFVYFGDAKEMDASSQGGNDSLTVGAADVTNLYGDASNMGAEPDDSPATDDHPLGGNDALTGRSNADATNKL